jgi:hypothetical protein
MEKKKLDENITTLKNFRHATQTFSGDIQIYVQVNEPGGEPSALIEVTEIMMNLPKNESDEPYIILRCY